METDEDLSALTAYLEAIEQAQSMSRESVWKRVAEEFDMGHIVDTVVATLAEIRTSIIFGIVGVVRSK